MLRQIAAGVLAAIAVGAGALAQDYGLPPTYGSATLGGGFSPDPFTVDLDSGGNIDASRLGGACSGFISNPPDFRLNYTGGALPLIISVRSRADTTLVINQPDGRWACDDDGGQHHLNPSITFNGSRTGAYDIWVGTFGEESLEEATLYISEITSQ